MSKVYICIEPWKHLNIIQMGLKQSMDKEVYKIIKKN